MTRNIIGVTVTLTDRLIGTIYLSLLERCDIWILCYVMCEITTRLDTQIVIVLMRLWEVMKLLQ